MLCIELSRNGEPQATAGFPGGGVVSAHFTGLLRVDQPPHCTFALHGLEVSTGRKWALDWIKGTAAVGDEFTIRFVELERVDPPSSREPFETPEQVREGELMQLERLEAQANEIRERLGLPPR